ncbi:hypothetical protein CLU79DRAFT_830996 [Phycomyces nitens]|nr:hypothetical protein CLU79DRAFT_830996 [Phycomyces nitens]
MSLLRTKLLWPLLACFTYLFFFTVPLKKASENFVEEEEQLITGDSSWQWQYNARHQDDYEQFPVKEPTETLVVPDLAYRPDEKFLTFFTHSGFQNQLIQVENGILLAWYLNRTLLLPNAFLGEAFGWSNFDKLHLEHMLRDPSTTEGCGEFAGDIVQWGIECPARGRYAVLPFDEIFDLSWAKKHVRILPRQRSDFGWLEKEFDIQRDNIPNHVNGSYRDGDILFFKGETRYDWRIFDTPRKNHRLGKYADSLDIYQLRQRPERLLHFSSLFGTGKLPIRRPEHYEFLRNLQRSIIYRHPAVLTMAEKIVERLGGHGNFIGLHVRSGDGWFIKALPENVNNIISQIQRAVDSKPGHSHPTLSVRPTLDQCLLLAATQNVTLVYMATDARSPQSNPAFDPVWNLFPCTFTIDDIFSPESSAWETLEVVDRNSGASLRKFLVPLVDATVASRGWFFIGSKGSTFSGYIYRLHDVFWSNEKRHQLGLEEV